MSTEIHWQKLISLIKCVTRKISSFHICGGWCLERTLGGGRFSLAGRGALLGWGVGYLWAFTASPYLQFNLFGVWYKDVISQLPASVGIADVCSTFQVSNSGQGIKCFCLLSCSLGWMSAFVTIRGQLPLVGGGILINFFGQFFSFSVLVCLVCLFGLRQGLMCPSLACNLGCDRMTMNSTDCWSFVITSGESRHEPPHVQDFVRGRQA